jgi:hypothetical protein
MKGGKVARLRQPTHTLGLKRVVARKRAALFTDLPQMRDGAFTGTIS